MPVYDIPSGTVIEQHQELEQLRQKLQAMHRRAQDAEAALPVWDEVREKNFITGSMSRALLRTYLHRIEEERHLANSILCAAMNWCHNLNQTSGGELLRAAINAYSRIRGVTLEEAEEQTAAVVEAVTMGLVKVEARPDFESLYAQAKAMVRAAYEEGWRDGVLDEGYGEDVSWEKSDTKAVLEGE